MPMTRTEVRAYLLRVRAADREAARYAALLEQTRALGAHMTDPAHARALTSLLEQRRADLLDLRLEMTRAIGALADSRYRSLLLGYYVQGLTWDQVAREMGYSYQNVLQFLHPKALDALGAQLSRRSGTPDGI